jgi:hypothetical protein
VNLGTVKTCTRCGETKPATREFFGSAPSGNTLKGYCRVCMNKASRERDKRDPEGRKARDMKRAQAGNGDRRTLEIKQHLWKVPSTLK